MRMAAEDLGQWEQVQKPGVLPLVLCRRDPPIPLPLGCFE